MKILFSEYKSDYPNYIFPYAIWAIPETNDTPSRIFARGFLPSTHNLDRFYLCRQIRIRLSEFSRSSENRRIMRKCDGIDYELIPRDNFNFSPEKRHFCKHYADIKFGKDIMTNKRLDSLFNSRIISHILVYKDAELGIDVGYATLYLEQEKLAYYYYAFYDLNYYDRNLGMYMMTSAVDYFAQNKYDYVYLGTCYSKNALYKTQFHGFEFFNGFRWSNDLNELKFLIKRDIEIITQHLVESNDFYTKFYDGDLDNIVQHYGFPVDTERSM